MSDPVLTAAQRLLDAMKPHPPLGSSWSWADVRLVAEAVTAEASLARRAQADLEQLRSWAREQNAGNAFAEQVAFWCSSRLGELDAALLVEPDEVQS